MADFPSQDVETLRQTLTKLFTFLMSDDADGRGFKDQDSVDDSGGRNHDSEIADSNRKPFWSCIDIPTAVERAVKEIYIRPDEAASNLHITRDLISPAERALYTTLLRAHPIVGPIFAAVNATLHTRSPAGDKIVLL